MYLVNIFVKISSLFCWKSIFLLSMCQFANFSPWKSSPPFVAWEDKEEEFFLVVRVVPSCIFSRLICFRVTKPNIFFDVKTWRRTFSLFFFGVRSPFFGLKDKILFIIYLKWGEFIYYLSFWMTGSFLREKTSSSMMRGKLYTLERSAQKDRILKMSFRKETVVYNYSLLRQLWQKLPH